MGDHSILVVNRLLSESTLDAVIESQNSLHTDVASRNEGPTTEFSSHRMDLNLGSSPRKLVECRICHDEDEDSSMETPCACCGSLKYAHRRCVQRWCNEKGNTICEICLQICKTKDIKYESCELKSMQHKEPLKPGYTSPTRLFCYGNLSMDFRGNWEISRRGLYNLQLSSMVATDDEPLESEYIAPSSRSLLCCRIVAISFIALLVLRFTLPIIINGTGAYSITMFMLQLLRFIGVVLPICIMATAFTAVQHHHQELDEHDLIPDEGNDFIHVH